jgi:predicted GNAT superfamily acetyltransferase
MYGMRTDALNLGVPTDRVIAEWEIAATDPSGAGAVPAATVDLPVLIRTGRDDRGRHVPIEVEPGGDAPRCVLEIPEKIAELRRDHPEVAEAWRVAVRQAFQASLAAGYQAVGFARDESSGRRRTFYVLDRACV